MYITAQRVRASQGGDEGINAFLHRHASSWAEAPPDNIPDRDPGELVRSAVIIEPGGNQVRSYLDIVAPEGTPWSTVRESFLQFVARMPPRPFPWSLTINSLKFVSG